MEKYSQAIIKIILEQEQVIGPLAVDLAKRATGLNVKSDKDVSIIGDPKVALGNLVDQYNVLFGKTSIEVSKKALKSLGSEFSQEDLPNILR